ncbi:MAG TPA: hypothetical protein VEX18_03540 [Polyangiaceae bacterium]|nr:hypothetical protein [Polyangiaceae bacterium]
MTSSALRRVIGLVSLLRRFALALGTALALTQAPRASAQIPAFVPAEPQALEPEPEPEAEPPPAAPAATDSAPLALPSGAPQPADPTPAKTDHLAPPGVQPAPAPSDDEVVDVVARPRRHWYGWQTLTADGASMLLLLAGAVAAENDTVGDSGDTMVTMGLIGYEFAPGIVHFAHGNPGRGFASFGMRLGMPIAGAFLGAATASGCDGFECEVSGAALGLLLGMGGAMAIDAAVFAYDDPERTDQGGEARLVPLVAVAPRAAWLGLAGRL